MIEPYVYMHIMHRISGEIHRVFRLNQLIALIGINLILLQVMNKVDVKKCITVNFVMVGKNYITTHLIIKLNDFNLV
jgi:hypothetical protein